MFAFEVFTKSVFFNFNTYWIENLWNLFWIVFVSGDFTFYVNVFIFQIFDFEVQFFEVIISDYHSKNALWIRLVDVDVIGEFAFGGEFERNYFSKNADFFIHIFCDFCRRDGVLRKTIYRKCYKKNEY